MAWRCDYCGGRPDGWSGGQGSREECGNPACPSKTPPAPADPYTARTEDGLVSTTLPEPEPYDPLPERIDPMDRTMPAPAAAPRIEVPERADGTVLVMHVERGNMRVVLPVHAIHAISTRVHVLAELVAGAFIEAQRSAPGRADEPVPEDERRIGLKLRGRDELLNPDRPLLPQTEGYWRIEDVPVQAQGEATARLPVGAFVLIDVARDTITL